MTSRGPAAGRRRRRPPRPAPRRVRRGAVARRAHATERDAGAAGSPVPSEPAHGLAGPRTLSPCLRRRPADGDRPGARRRGPREPALRRPRRRRQRPPLRPRAGGPDPDRARRAASLPEPFLDISGRISSGGERGLLGLAFAPTFADRRPLLRGLHRPRRRHRRERVPGPRPGRRPGRRRRPSASSSGSTSRSPTTTAVPSRSAPTGCSGSRPATAAPAATRRATASAWTRSSASSCGSTRGPPRARRYGIPADNPFVGRAGGQGGARRDLGLRAAQPVALLVRPGDRRPLDRRRRAERDRGGRPLAGRLAGGPELRLEHDGGERLLRAGRRLRPGGPGPAGGRVRPRPRLRGHRRLRLPRRRRRPAWPAPTSSATTAAARSGASTPPAARPEPRALLRDRGLAIASFGEDEAGEVYVVDLAGGRVFRVVASGRPGGPAARRRRRAQARATMTSTVTRSRSRRPRPASAPHPWPSASPRGRPGRGPAGPTAPSRIARTGPERGARRPSRGHPPSRGRPPRRRRARPPRPRPGPPPRTHAVEGGGPGRDRAVDRLRQPGEVPEPGDDAVPQLVAPELRRPITPVVHHGPQGESLGPEVPVRRAGRPQGREDGGHRGRGIGLGLGGAWGE